LGKKSFLPSFLPSFLLFCLLLCITAIDCCIAEKEAFPVPIKIIAAIPADFHLTNFLDEGYESMPTLESGQSYTITPGINS